MPKLPPPAAWLGCLHCLPERAGVPHFLEGLFDSPGVRHVVVALIGPRLHCEDITVMHFDWYMLQLQGQVVPLFEQRRHRVEPSC